jgi:hypothetical protein
MRSHTLQLLSEHDNTHPLRTPEEQIIPPVRADLSDALHTTHDGMGAYLKDI